MLSRSERCKIAAARTGGRAGYASHEEWRAAAAEQQAARAKLRETVAHEHIAAMAGGTVESVPVLFVERGMEGEALPHVVEVVKATVKTGTFWRRCSWSARGRIQVDRRLTPVAVLGGGERARYEAAEHASAEAVRSLLDEAWRLKTEAGKIRLQARQAALQALVGE